MTDKAMGLARQFDRIVGIEDAFHLAPEPRGHMLLEFIDEHRKDISMALHAKDTTTVDKAMSAHDLLGMLRVIRSVTALFGERECDVNWSLGESEAIALIASRDAALTAELKARCDRLQLELGDDAAVLARIMPNLTQRILDLESKEALVVNLQARCDALEAAMEHHAAGHSSSRYTERREERAA